MSGVVAEVAPERVAEDDDPVVGPCRSWPRRPGRARTRRAASAVGDHDRDVLERVAQQVGQIVERVAHELLEVLVVERVELEELAFVGRHGEPFARQQLGVAHDLVELRLGLRVAPAGHAHRDERHAPISAAATITPSATSSSARTAPIELKPWPTTSTTSPSDIAMIAATPTRRK